MLVLTATSRETFGVLDISSRKRLTILANAFDVGQVLQHSRYAADFEQARKFEIELEWCCKLDEPQ